MNAVMKKLRRTSIMVYNNFVSYFDLEIAPTDLAFFKRTHPISDFPILRHVTIVGRRSE